MSYLELMVRDSISMTKTHRLMFSIVDFWHGMSILGDFNLIETSTFAKFLLTTLVGSSRVGGEAAAVPSLSLLLMAILRS